MRAPALTWVGYAGLVLLLGGCAVGHTVPYATAVARLETSGTQTVAVAAHDQRRLVTSGRERPTFVGEFRSLYHIPYGVTTTSGQPLATDVTAALSTSFASKGFTVVSVAVAHSDSPASVVQKVTGPRIDRGVLLTIAEWRTDTYFKTQLFYDLTLTVVDRNGTVLADHQATGHEDELRGAFADALRQQLEFLLNQATVRSALTASPTPAGLRQAWYLVDVSRLDQPTVIGAPHASLEACRSARTSEEASRPTAKVVCELRPAP